jgi:hypothetical protein
MTLAYRMKRRKTRRYAKDFYCDAPITRDPTFTFNLRRNYKSEVEFRWRKVRATVVDAVSRQDMLGTNMLKPSAASMLSGGQDKIKLFQDWFDRLLAVAVLENDGNWLTPMVTSAYNRGIERAMMLSNSKALPPDRDTVIAALRQFAFVELQGIVEAVSQVAVRSVAEGLINERNKSVIVSGITDAVQNIGVVRSRAMVDTIIVKSFNVASLDQFAAAGLKNVGILSETIPAAKPLLHDAKKKKKSIIQKLLEEPEQVEVLTAGDDDVCPICEDISLGGPYFIDDAYDLIPAHPHCRCAFVPAEDRRFAAIEHDAADYDPDQPRDPHGRFEGGGAIAGTLRSPEEEHNSMMVRLHKEALEKVRAAQKAMQTGDADFSRASMYVWKQGDVVIAGVRDEFDPGEARDPDGKWTTGGGSAAAPEEAKTAQSPKAEAKVENERNLSKPLDKREEMALNGYSKNLSQDINKDLRGQERTAKAIKNNPDAIVKDYTKAMDSAFDKASTAKDITTFRAVSARTWEKMQASGEFKDNAFVSTTTSHRIAEKFGKDELKGGHVVVNLDIPKGSKAIYMADKSNHAGEREVLLARGSTWKRGADRDGRPTFTLHSTIKDEWNEEDHPRVPAGQPGAGEFEGANSGGAEKPAFSGAAIEKGAPASKEELKKQGLVTLMGRQQNLQKAINEEKDPDKRQALRQELLKNMEVQHQLYTEKGNTKRQAEYAYKIDKLKSQLQAQQRLRCQGAERAQGTRARCCTEATCCA